ncbi:aminotransferase class V-fold PLP-dependent enzyme [Trebonia kvetii]|uniref:Aminotransferase class V-fold PLP-dependent enzyme n=1 Tax=Trebonia kvetii TaxID=2480626 RepID=A0A6P2BSU5_9ACTN|nr:aminotransferase class V-fold PLP-dependent enzyme [Trebonia kvetii]TVZ01948.1 aminotransferase class V-fold PLP-dependent enzyme [Trebonia kvetii]
MASLHNQAQRDSLARAVRFSMVKPDFVPVSWYKVFGYPTGVGCLIARREALQRLRRPWFAGGSVYLASALAGWCTPAADEARFEDGTLSFLQIPDLEAGLSWINGIGIDLIHQRVMCLTGWLLDRLAALRHRNGEPMARIYAIRTGCFCNPGAVEAAFNLTRADWRRALRGTARTTDQYLELLGMPSGGSLRASLGLASNVDDVERLLAFVQATYRDRVVRPGGLAPRKGC